jgi:hypothetical protein
MNKYLLLIVLPVVLFSCKSKKVSLAVNDESVNISDFLESFQPLQMPYEVTDTILRRKDPETALINTGLFVRFVPDSILFRLFGKETRVRIYAIGRIRVPDAENYLFVKGTGRDRRILYILCFDKKNRFAAARAVLYSDNESGVTGKVDMDNKYTLTLLHQRKASDGQIFYHRDAYVFAEGTGFSLILTESNEGKPKIAPVYDPIDTLPHKHRYSGDYAQDKRNLVSVRDGRDPSRFLFFVHFEKNGGTCKGELKGEAKFISPGVARFRSYSDPCAIEFTFIPEGVSLKETGGCGVHRDIPCFFEGYFERKKTPHSGQKAHHN